MYVCMHVCMYTHTRHKTTCKLNYFKIYLIQLGSVGRHLLKRGRDMVIHLIQNDIYKHLTKFKVITSV